MIGQFSTVAVSRTVSIPCFSSVVIWSSLTNSFGVMPAFHVTSSSCQRGVYVGSPGSELNTGSCPVAAVLPHSDEMMNLASEGIFVLRYPDHPMTALYKQVAADLLA